MSSGIFHTPDSLFIVWLQIKLSLSWCLLVNKSPWRLIFSCLQRHTTDFSAQTLAATHSSDGNGDLTAAAHTGDISVFVFGCATFFFFNADPDADGSCSGEKETQAMDEISPGHLLQRKINAPLPQGVQDHMTSPEPQVSGPRASKFTNFVNTNRKHKHITASSSGLLPIDRGR